MYLPLPWLALFFLSAGLTTLALPSINTNSTAACRCFPGDSCWPDQAEWAAFNVTVGGRLINTLPIGSVCHGFAFNQDRCDALRQVYNDPETHLRSSSSLMAPFWANRSCDVFGAKDDQCVKGTYIDHAVKVQTVTDVLNTIQFVKANNIRLVVRNTGHDYLGKSTGAGALGLWMHHLEGFDVVDYRSRYYSGKAVKLAAGMLSSTATEKAHNHGLTIVGGNCPTVGIAGGYTQGGGLGPLTSRYGFAADQVLEWEVVTVDGNLRKATPNTDTDLYWALSGGGGGTFGVVVSMTVKAYPEERVASANLTFSSSGISQDGFYEAVEAFHGSLPELSATGGVAIYSVQNTSFALAPATLPGKGKEDLDALLRPALLKLQSLNISYTYASIEAPSYYEAYKLMNPPSETAYFQIGGRVLAPHTLSLKLAELTKSLRDVNAYGAALGGLSFQIPISLTGHPLNSVQSRLRDGALSLTVATIWSNTDWNQNIVDQGLMTNTLIPAIDRLTPSQSTAYLNEANFQEQQWQRVFYGESYSQLLATKSKYDPDHVLWARTAVGSEAWTETGDGRLCLAK